MLKAFVEDGNDIVLEDDILEALSFRDGIAGTAVLLYNCSNLPSKTLEKKYKSAKVSSRATHEINWYEDKLCINESSEVTAPEVVLTFFGFGRPKYSLHISFNMTWLMFIQLSFLHDLGCSNF